MSNFYLNDVNFYAQIDELWAIFEDSLEMFSDITLECAGHKSITNKYELYDLFRWTLDIPRHNDYIGVYNFQDHLIGLSYITHITPLEPFPDQSDYATYAQWEKDLQWEGCYHGSLHPGYRTPKFSSLAVKRTVRHFAQKNNIAIMFAFLREDNRQGNLLLRRNGFNLIELMKAYRKHGGVDTDYNLYVYRGG